MATLKVMASAAWTHSVLACKALGQTTSMLRSASRACLAALARLLSELSKFSACCSFRCCARLRLAWQIKNPRAPMSPRRV